MARPSILDRRRFLTGVLAVTAVPWVAHAQQAGRSWRVGLLDTGSPSPERQAHWRMHQEVLKDAGYVEGRNVAFEFRWGGGDIRALPALASELVRMKVDVIVAAQTPAALAAKQVTSTVPIVLVVSGDPVRTGLVANLSRPGGNVTGLTTLSTELSVKRLALLKEVLPALAHIGIVWDDNPAFALAVQETERAARGLGVAVRTRVVRHPEELESAVRDLAGAGVGALEIMPGRVFLDERQRLAALALRYRLATLYAQREYVEAGGLLSYGSSLTSHFVRAASYVEKILKGARPADLPIEQPTTFELAVNVRTARTLGVTLPGPLLLRADRVVD